MTGVPTPTPTSSAPSPPDTSARPSSRARSFALLAAAALGLGLIWLLVAALRFSEGAMVDGVWRYVADDAWAFDLEAYMAAAIRLGTDGTLYDAAQIDGPYEPGGPGMFQYAPPFGLAMLPLSGMEVTDAAVLWYVLRIAALLLACAIMPVSPILRILGFAVIAFSWPVLKDAVLGNVSILLVLPLAIGWRFLDRPVGSIALAVAAIIRPSIGVFLLWQLARRRWVAAAWLAGTVAMIVLASLPFVGIEGYRDYFAVLRNLAVPAAGSENRDFSALAIALGAQAPWADVARIASIAVGTVAILMSLRRDAEVGYMVTLMASLLLVPLLWDHYLVTLLLPAAFLAERIRPVFILLPLLAWLPGLALPFVVLAATLLPFAAPDRRPAGPGRASRASPSPLVGSPGSVPGG